MSAKALAWPEPRLPTPTTATFTVSLGAAWPFLLMIRGAAEATSDAPVALMNLRRVHCVIMSFLYWSFSLILGIYVGSATPLSPVCDMITGLF
jgi:hypothetical protein